MKKKIYIAGSGGMLGKAFHEIFGADYELRCSDKDVNESWLNFCDFRNFDHYREEVITYKPDYLFHLGAHTDLEYCQKNEQDAIDTNVKSVENACKIALELDIPILYISTAGIFDGKQDTYDDDDHVVPISIYGQTKYDGELAVKNKIKKYFICRAGWMMGGGPSKDKKFINKVMKQLKAGKNELFIVNDKAGTPTYTIDFAKNVKLLVEKNEYGLYNMVCSGVTDRVEVTHELLRLLKLENKVKITEVNSDYFKVEYAAPRPESERLINARLNEKGLNQMRNWKICLSEYLDKDFKGFLESK